MDDKRFASRNDALGFAARTRKNLEFLDNAANTGEDVHVVTQLINSLLGLVVFLHERKLSSRFEKMLLADLDGEGWPHIEVTLGQNECSTLYQLMYHIRNAVAHGRLHFSSDSRRLHEVMVEFEDWKPSAKKPYVCFKLNGSALHEFCLKLMALVEPEIG